MDELRRARINEATLQKQEYESIMTQVKTEKSNVKLGGEKKKLASMEHRKVLQEQIEEKLKKVAFARKQGEGQALKREYAEELDKLERIRLEAVSDLAQAGVNPLYLPEMKALDIERIRNR